jgi:hypothetical protein
VTLREEARVDRLAPAHFATGIEEVVVLLVHFQALGALVFLDGLVKGHYGLCLRLRFLNLVLARQLFQVAFDLPLVPQSAGVIPIGRHRYRHTRIEIVLGWGAGRRQFRWESHGVLGYLLMQ